MATKDGEVVMHEVTDNSTKDDEETEDAAAAWHVEVSLWVP